MLYFMVCGDEAAAVRECASRGWVQVGVGRFYTTTRDDVRVIRRFVDMFLAPGGTWLMAGPGYAANPERGEFDKLIELGAARWVTGEEPKAEPEVEELEYEIPAPEPFNPPLMNHEELVAKFRRPGRPSTGARPSQPPYRR